jgi:hypothetical protein
VKHHEKWQTSVSNGEMPLPARLREVFNDRNYKITNIKYI